MVASVWGAVDQTTNLTVTVTGDNTGVVSASAAFNAAWVTLQASRSAPSANNSYVKAKIVVPPGLYLIDSSINWTNLLTWNIHVEAEGAVLFGTCAGKVVLDATNVRGLHIHGLEIYGDSTNRPIGGLLLGPKNTDACGNNRLEDVKVQGYFTKAAYWNIGSETTRHDGSYFANSYAVAGACGALMDGRNAHGAVSDYTTLRAADTAVSFTVNKFYGCHFRQYSGVAGAPALYIDAVKEISCDENCYYLAFAGAAVQIYNHATYRNANVKLEGSFETTQAPGLDYVVELLVPAATFSGINGFILKTEAVNSKTAAIKTTDPAAGTPGTLTVRFADIQLNAAPAAGTYLDCVNLSLLGTLKVASGAALNLSTGLAEFHGMLYCNDFTTVTMPAGATANNFICFDDNYGRVIFSGAQNWLSLLSATTHPEIRSEGASADIDIRLTPKGNGRARFGTFNATGDVACNGYIEIKDAGGIVRKVMITA